MRAPGVIIGGIVTAFVGACLPITPHSLQPSVSIARQVELELPASSELTLAADVTQLLEIDYRGERYVMQTHVELRPGKVVLVVMDLLGTFLLSVEYDKEVIVSDTIEGWPRTFPVESVLADFLLAFLPHDLVSDNLNGATLEQSADGRIRRITRGSREIIEIRFTHAEPWLGVVEFSHLERGYLMTVETVGYSSK